MTPIENEKRSERLSLYLDGALSPTETREVEEWLRNDADARRELEELRRLTTLLSSRTRVPADPAFWTRLSAQMEHRATEAGSLLPFPRRYLPAMAGMAVVVVAAIGFAVIQNRMGVLQYFSRQSQAVKNAYERGLLQGNILPVLASVDRDAALRFSLFGTLPLDESSQTTLRVDQSSDRGYRIEVGKPARTSEQAVTFNRFMAEVKPNARQRQVIDSLIDFTSRRLASSVWVGDNNALAIDPDLPRLNRNVVAGIASCLEPVQRVEMERILTTNRAPYTVEIGKNIPAEPELVLKRFRPMPRPQRFVLIRPDTTGLAQVEIDLDSLRREALENMRAMEQRRAEFFRQFAAEQYRVLQSEYGAAPSAPTMDDSEFMRVEVGRDVDDRGVGVIHVTVVPRHPVSGEGGDEFGTGPVRIRIFRAPDGRPDSPQVDLPSIDSAQAQLRRQLRELNDARSAAAQRKVAPTPPRPTPQP